MERTKYPIGSRLFDSSYIIDGFISAVGATSQVYLVHRIDDPTKKCAAKVIYRQEGTTDAYWNKFAEEEVTSLRIMNQENLVQTYDTFNVNKDDLCAKVLIMEYVDGISLRDYINKHGCIIPKVALNIFAKVLAGIKVLHNYKHIIIHRDLKPENIIMSHDLSKITILDFGIATVLQNAQDDLEGKNIQCFTDESLQPQGTIPYVTPDILLPRAKNTPPKITVQYDFYSLGVILYEMLMGDRPFDYDKMAPGASAKKKLELPIKYDIYNISSNPTITPSIENMIFKCLASKPQDLHFRYNSINEIIEDCNKAIESLNHKEDNTPLLKPVNQRTYPRFRRFNIDVVKDNVKWYKSWKALLVIGATVIALFVTAIIIFFK